jgi:hypothetical protein
MFESHETPTCTHLLLCAGLIRTAPRNILKRRLVYTLATHGSSRICLATSCWSISLHQPTALGPHASNPRVPRCRRSANKSEDQSIGRTTANFTHHPTLMVTQTDTFQPLFTNVSRWRSRRMHCAGACQQAIEFTLLPFS